MTKEEQQFNQWFDEYADGVKVFEEADMKQAYLQGRAELEKENAELKQAKEGKVVERFEAYGQCRDSRRIAELEKENAELKEKCNSLQELVTYYQTNFCQEG